MYLTDKKIIEELEKGNIEIDPFNPEHLNPNSYDLTLSNQVKVLHANIYKPNSLVDVKKSQAYKTIPMHEDRGLIIFPNNLYIMGTNEKAGSRLTHHMTLSGKSSLARLGLSIHLTAGWGDTGFVNNWTLEVTCIYPTKLYPGMRIAQIAFSEINGEIGVPYDKKKDSKYNENNNAKGSEYYKNF